MTKNYLKVINDFANSSPMATEIKVEISEYVTSMKPRHENSKCYYEHAELLSSLIRGAEHFCYYLQRNGYEIRRKRGSSKSKKD